MGPNSLPGDNLGIGSECRHCAGCLYDGKTSAHQQWEGSAGTLQGFRENVEKHARAQEDAVFGDFAMKDN